VVPQLFLRLNFALVTVLVPGVLGLAGIPVQLAVEVVSRNGSVIVVAVVNFIPLDTVEGPTTIK